MQGKVADFGIPDIFQLIASQGKSGILRIVGDNREIIFHFADGMIVDVFPDRKVRPPEGMLGRMLVDAGYLSDAELRRVLAAQQKGGKRLGEILVEERKISPETLGRYLRLQVKETLYFSLRIAEGEYRFESCAVRPPSWMTEPFRADVLLMEGMQFLDEYPVFREKFPPGKFSVARAPGVKADLSSLSEEERVIWRNLDFSSDPWRVCRKACVTWFEGVRALSMLLERGYIRVAPVEEKPGDAAREIRLEMERRLRLGWVRAACWSAVFAAAAWWLYNAFLSPAAAPAFSSWIAFF